MGICLALEALGILKEGFAACLPFLKRKHLLVVELSLVSLAYFPAFISTSEPIYICIYIYMYQLNIFC